MLSLKEKLKLVLIFVDHIFGTCCWVGGWVGTLKTLLKALILSKSPEYSKLDSLAYNYEMGVLLLHQCHFFSFTN
jgi:hypothetical protein